MICERCGVVFLGDWRKKKNKTPCRFCCVSCSHTKTPEARRRTSLSLLGKKHTTPVFCRSCGKRTVTGTDLCKVCFCKFRLGSGKYGLTLEDGRVNYVTKRKRILKDFYIERAGAKCIKCGYDKCIGSLHFHHRNPKEKLFQLNVTNFSKPKDLIEAEIRKCDLVCANCHGEIHYTR